MVMLLPQPHSASLSGECRPAAWVQLHGGCGFHTGSTSKLPEQLVRFMSFTSEVLIAWVGREPQGSRFFYPAQTTARASVG